MIWQCCREKILLGIDKKGDEDSLVADVFLKEKRSEIMSKIKGKDTEIEIRVRKYLFSKGYRYRKNDSRYPGSPDIVLPKYQTMVFINGCFWHGHDNCDAYHAPKTNTKYWEDKIGRTKARDEENVRYLEEIGWKVIVVWECEIKKDFCKTMVSLIAELKKGKD